MEGMPGARGIPAPSQASIERKEKETAKTRAAELRSEVVALLAEASHEDVELFAKFLDAQQTVLRLKDQYDAGLINDTPNRATLRRAEADREFFKTKLIEAIGKYPAEVGETLARYLDAQQRAGFN